MDLKGLKFSKMHGIGNDFPIIDESKGKVISEEDKPQNGGGIIRIGFSI